MCLRTETVCLCFSESQLTKDLFVFGTEPEGPASLILETDYDRDVKWTGQFDLRWSDVGQATASFLVAWCRGNIATLICDREEKVSHGQKYLVY